MLNWARRTSWGWWDDWDDRLQTQDSKFKPWWSEAEHATSRSRRLPSILTFTHGWGRNIFCFFQTAETRNRTPNCGVKGSGANHYPRAPALCSLEMQMMDWKLSRPQHEPIPKQAEMLQGWYRGWRVFNPFTSPLCHACLIWYFKDRYLDQWPGLPINRKPNPITHDDMG